MAACGDDSRGVMASVNPQLSALHARGPRAGQARQRSRDPQDRRLSRDLVRRGAHRDLRRRRSRSTARTYMPRKFKIGFVVPPINDIDVYTQDLGFIAIVEAGRARGLQRRDRRRHGPHRPGAQHLSAARRRHRLHAGRQGAATWRRGHGGAARLWRPRRSRPRAVQVHDRRQGPRFHQGARSSARLGFRLEPARPFTFTSNGDPIGWARGEDGREHFTLFIENGRVSNCPAQAADGRTARDRAGPQGHVPR